MCTDRDTEILITHSRDGSRVLSTDSDTLSLRCSKKPVGNDLLHQNPPTVCRTRKGNDSVRKCLRLRLRLNLRHIHLYHLDLSATRNYSHSPRTRAHRALTSNQYQSTWLCGFSLRFWLRSTGLNSTMPLMFVNHL